MSIPQEQFTISEDALRLIVESAIIAFSTVESAKLGTTAFSSPDVIIYRIQESWLEELRAKDMSGYQAPQWTFDNDWTGYPDAENDDTRYYNESSLDI